MTTKQETAVERMELREIERLIPSARNARTHSQAQVAEIAGSIRAFGFIVPVLVDSKGLVIAGHGRVLAARLLKLDRIPVLVIDHLSEAEKRAYAIADNKITLNAGWDEDLLRVELEALALDGIGPSSLGFSEEEFNALIVDLQPKPTQDPDVIPQAPRKTVSQTGDLWQLGEHKLLCGNALDPASYAALLGEKTAAMVFTTPVYKVDGCTLGEDNSSDNRFGPFLEGALKHILQYTGGALYICTRSSELHELHTAFSNVGGHFSAFVICGKNSLTPSSTDYQPQFEPILYGWTKGKPHYWCGAQDQGDLWMAENTETEKWGSMIKPVELVERAVRNSSRPGDIVLDPFAGAGSTVIACERAGRVARVIEQEPKRCDVIIERWQDFTGKEAIHISTGQTLSRRFAILASGD